MNHLLGEVLVRHLTIGQQMLHHERGKQRDQKVEVPLRGHLAPGHGLLEDLPEGSPARIDESFPKDAAQFPVAGQGRDQPDHESGPETIVHAGGTPGDGL